MRSELRTFANDTCVELVGSAFLAKDILEIAQELIIRDGTLVDDQQVFPFEIVIEFFIEKTASLAIVGYSRAVIAVHAVYS